MHLINSLFFITTLLASSSSIVIPSAPKTHLPGKTSPEWLSSEEKAVYEKMSHTQQERYLRLSKEQRSKLSALLKESDPKTKKPKYSLDEALNHVESSQN